MANPRITTERVFPYRYNLFRSRAGIMHNLLWALTWFVVLGIIILSLYAFATRVQSDTRFERIKTTTDMALLASAAPGPAPSYFLPLPLSAWRIRFENGRAHAVAIERTPGPAGASIRAIDESSTYLIAAGTPIDSPEIPPATQADLFKSGERITIQPRTPSRPSGPTPSLNTLICPANPLTDQDTIIIDPGHGGTTSEEATTGDPGWKSKKITESAATTIISQEILAGLRTARRTAALTRPDNSPIDQTTRIDRIFPTSTLISIHAHPSSDGRASITAIVPASTRSSKDDRQERDSTALACTIINTILESNPSFKTGGGAIIPIETSALPPNDYRRILEKPRSGVILIIIGIDITGQANPLIDQEREIGKRIAQALTQTQTPP